MDKIPDILVAPIYNRINCDLPALIAGLNHAPTFVVVVDKDVAALLGLPKIIVAAEFGINTFALALNCHNALVVLPIGGLSPPNSRYCDSSITSAFLEILTAISCKPCWRHFFLYYQRPHRYWSPILVSRHLSADIGVLVLYKPDELRRIDRGHSVHGLILDSGHVCESLADTGVLATGKSQVITLAGFERFRRSILF